MIRTSHRADSLNNESGSLHFFGSGFEGGGDKAGSGIDKIRAMPQRQRAAELQGSAGANAQDRGGGGFRVS